MAFDAYCEVCRQDRQFRERIVQSNYRIVKYNACNVCNSNIGGKPIELAELSKGKKHWVDSKHREAQVKREAEKEERRKAALKKADAKERIKDQYEMWEEVDV